MEIGSSDDVDVKDVKEVERDDTDKNLSFDEKLFKHDFDFKVSADGDSGLFVFIRGVLSEIF